MTTLTKALISKEDLKSWDGVSDTFSRPTSTGGTQTVNKINDGHIDVLQVYGDGSTRTETCIIAAQNAVGSTNKVSFLLTGAWTLGANLTINENITLKFSPGATITTTGYTLTVNGALDAGPRQQVFTGTGTVTGTPLIDFAYPEWFGTNTTPGTTDMTAAIRAALTFHSTNRWSDTYLVTDQLIIPARQVIDATGSNLQYDDGGSGEYVFSSGIADTNNDSLRINNLKIVLKTTTAKGIYLLNNRYSMFTGITSVEGNIPDDWAANQAAVLARTNVGLQITSSAATDAFSNYFEFLHLNHLHTGIWCPADAIANAQYFGHIQLFGDWLYGDYDSVGMMIEGCSYSTVNSFYIESYDGGTSGADTGGVVFKGSRANGWKFNAGVFDYTLYDGGYPTMHAVRFQDDGTGDPSDNTFKDVAWADTTNAIIKVVDDTAGIKNNHVDGNPSQVAQTWTATMTAATSGTITLVSGVNGDTCFVRKQGREVRVWGQLVVDSVSSPVGRLFIGGLPFQSTTETYAQPPVTLYGNNFTTGANDSLVGVTVAGNSQIEIRGYQDGNVLATTANLVQATTTVTFDVTYTARAL